jgi:bla regulator protein blaR1
MKKLVLWMIALAALPGGALMAQNMTGTWQGALKAGPPGQTRELRIVIKISRADDESLKAAMYSIDQGGRPINANAVTQRGSDLKISVVAIGGTYEGKLSSDGNSIAGTWTQGPGALPLNLTRATPQTAWAIPEPPPPPTPMPADANPSFEVATIKPSKPGRPGKLLTMRGRQFLTVNTTLSDLIVFAYGIHPKQIVGAPAWIDSDKYDLAGEPDAKGQPSLNQVKVMLQKLLADRFQLAFHHDKKELSVYALRVAKNGPKLTRSQADPHAPPRLLFTKLGNLPAGNASMADFAGVMQAAVLEKPVLDQTGLSGKWDFTLTWTPDPTQFAGLRNGAAPPPVDPNGPPDLFAAIQQQLGLKLESTKAPVDVLVIDRVEKPSAN